ncbi:cell wall-binding repeat-containing protein [Bacillus sp. REN3]|uniref:cell wall-binding repeat-containing protein n=1 Tax=Bacillus sp. REN3 TaxID=2802440 RepID=UPI001AEE4C96|nr:cell wall-binding repeat-containing protein [Bacillus sp. REN3]
MKKLSVLASILIAISLVFPTHPEGSPPNNKVQKLVLFKEMIDDNVIKETGSTIIERYENIPVALIEIPNDRIGDFSAAKTVISIENEQKAEAAAQASDWSTTAVQAQKAWHASFTGKNIKIAIIDTGISPHPDLEIAGGKSFVPYTSSFSDDNGHGTHIAGIVAARNNDIGTVGVAPGALLYAVKVLDKNGDGYLTDIVKAIDWSITNNIDIINLSLGSLDHSPALEYSIKKAYNSGVMIVAAGGNEGNAEGYGDNVAYPARYDSVIAVSAVDQQKRRGNFSATGNAIEYAAPGVGILSTYLNNRYARLDGTSMAAGFVTGNLALLKEMYPSMSNARLREQMRKTAIDLGTPGRDPWFGYGMVQSPQSPERISGMDRFEVAAKASKRGWPSASTVFISNSNAFADALSAAPLAYKKNAPLLLTGQSSLHPATKKEITRLGATEVILVGGTGSISGKVENELKTMGKRVKRIGGKNRFEVSRNIALQLGTFKKAVVANGINFPDALAIAPYAAKQGIPILLTKPDKLPVETAEVLKSRPVEETIVVGGEASVNKTVYSHLVKPVRIGGKDRYEVALNIHVKYFPEADRLFIATGSTFADALSGSVLIAKENTTLLLTGRDALPGSVAAVLGSRKDRSYVVLGGTGSVGNGIIYALNK